MADQFQGDFWECGFLKESTTELKKHEQLASKNRQVFKKRFEQSYEKVSDLLNIDHWNRQQADCLARTKKLKRDKDVILSKICSDEDEKTNLLRESSNLQQIIVEKRNEAVDLAEELKQKVEEKFHVAEDLMRQRTEVRNKHEAIKEVKLLNKSLLKFHVRFEGDCGDGAVFVVTLDIDKHLHSVPSTSLKVVHDRNKIWRLLEIRPEVPNFNLLSKKLQESQDIVGLLAHLRNTS